MKLLTVLLILFISSEAWAQGELMRDVQDGIMKLQPAHTRATSASLVDAFIDAGEDEGLDPLLLVAMAFRESSLLPRRVGSKGERGLLQVHGAALFGRPAKCSQDLDSIWCEVSTGARWLSKSKSSCPGSWYRWVTAYGIGRCLDEETSRSIKGTLKARRYYVSIGGRNWN